MIGRMKRAALWIAAAIILACGAVLWLIRAHRTPPPPPPLSSTISAGGSDMLAIDAEGHIFVWGSGRDGQLALLDACFSRVPVAMLGGPTWRSVHDGGSASYAIATDGTLWRRTFGREGCGLNLRLRRAYEPLNWSSHWLKVEEARGVAVGLDEQHTLWFWRDSEILPEAARDLGGQAQVALSKVNAVAQWQDFCMGTNTSYAVASDGTLWRNAVALKSMGPSLELARMVQVTAPVRFTRVFCRFNGLHVLALDGQGKLWGLGDNFYGELAQRSSGRPLSLAAIPETPIQRVTEKKWRDVAVGTGFTIAIAADGSLWSWGDNGRSTLGTGDRENSSKPRRVDYWHQWAAVSAGHEFAMGLTTEGAIYTWGTNIDGALGDGVATHEHLTPTPVSGKKRWMVPTDNGPTEPLGD